MQDLFSRRSRDNGVTVRLRGSEMLIPSTSKGQKAVYNTTSDPRLNGATEVPDVETRNKPALMIRHCPKKQGRHGS